MSELYINGQTVKDTECCPSMFDLNMNKEKISYSEKSVLNT